MGGFGIIVLLVFIFLAFSFSGWLLKILGWIFNLLGEGFSTSWGCLIWIIAIVIVAMIL